MMKRKKKVHTLKLPWTCEESKVFRERKRREKLGNAHPISAEDV